MKYTDGEYYYIYNRGAHKAPIFFSRENYQCCLKILIKYSSQYKVRVFAHCLMPNHYHFVLKQDNGGSISRFVQTTFNSYVQAVNLQLEHSGTLFQGRVQSKHLASDEYVLQAVRYVHLNPVEAGIVTKPEDWEFSDCGVWCGIRISSLTVLSLRDGYFKNAGEYQRFVKEYEAESSKEVFRGGQREPSEGQEEGLENLRKGGMLRQGKPSEGQNRSSENLRNVGVLFIVATPIGNLEDITYRAIKVLSTVDVIAAEDTRKTKILLDHYGISKPMVSYFSYNERARTPQLIEKLLAGQSVAVVSDAGTPGISDPAHLIVNEAIVHDIPIVPIPGPSAFLSALIVSGLPTDNFVFEGFLPRKKGRKTRFQELKSESRTIVLFESPHRVFKTLNEILNNWGDRHIAVARELTKKFEEVTRGPVSAVIRELSAKPARGEYVLIVEGLPK